MPSVCYPIVIRLLSFCVFLATTTSGEVERERHGKPSHLVEDDNEEKEVERRTRQPEASEEGVEAEEFGQVLLQVRVNLQHGKMGVM